MDDVVAVLDDQGKIYTRPPGRDQGSTTHTLVVEDGHGNS